MSCIYREGRLYVEDVALEDVAERFGTPCYVYSRAVLEANWHAYDRAFGTRPHRICYAVKANGNLALLNLLARLGSGFDIVSAGELERVLVAGGSAGKTVFAGVGKTAAELTRALEAGVACFNIESMAELERLNQTAAGLNCRADIAVRVNPAIDARTHPYIATGLHENKFGVPKDEAPEVYRRALGMANVRTCGIACHIGSQLTSMPPIVDALNGMMELVGSLGSDGIRLEHVDVGGGLGIGYQDESPPTITEYVETVCRIVGPEYLTIVEPGRSIVGEAGVLLTTVEYIKCTSVRKFAIVDAAMTDLLRPALYGAWHDVLPLNRQSAGAAAETYDIVGPVCETGDFLAKGRVLNIAAGERLAVLDAGAYGFVMASTYNARPRACEILVDGADCHMIRARESTDDLIRGEAIAPVRSDSAL